MRLFVTGTDTGVGKTFFCALLARHWREQGLDPAYIKPVQTGSPPDDDAAFVRDFAGLAPHRARALFTAPEPVSPCFVFDPFPYAEALSAIAAEPAPHLIVEGAGGLTVPLDFTRSTWELARDAGLAVAVVVPNRLGCLNHALLTHHFLASHKIPFAGFAVNRHFASDEKNAARNLDALRRLVPGGVRWVFGEGLREERGKVGQDAGGRIHG
jgi:dethiobiotin synthetase